MKLTYIAAGSNLGDRSHSLEQACQLLLKTAGIRFSRASKIYETDPVGGPEQGKYLNAVWEIETTLSPQKLLAELLDIEKKLGRVRVELNGPRTIDLDILFYGDQVVAEPGLHIPHPRLHTRSFVLQPLMDLCPDLKHPQLKKTIRELFRDEKVKS